jgi:hypothetical protein
MLQAGRSRVRFPMRLLDSSVYLIIPGSTQHITEMKTRNRPGNKRRPSRIRDNLIAVCEPVVEKLSEFRRLTNLWASAAP